MTLQQWYLPVVLLLTVTFFSACRDDGPRVLVFSKTEGWVHSSIPFANEAIEKLGVENGYRVDLSQDATLFNDEDL
jgi:cytochrome c